MNIKRRNLIQGSIAASTLLLPSVASATKVAGMNNAPSAVANARLEKSIKASFGGGFSLRTHTQSGGRTYANIEHFGNQYAVASADLIEWQIVSPR